MGPGLALVLVSENCVGLGQWGQMAEAEVEGVWERDSGSRYFP